MTQKLHIANYFDADRRSVIAGEAIGIGEVIKIVANNNVSGGRQALKVTAVGDVQNAGQWGVAFKVSAEPLAVSSSTVSAALGQRIATIASGDQMVEVRRGAILEYDASLLHTSLDPDNGGATPAVGASLGVNTTGATAKWSTAATTSLANVGTTIHVARVFKVFGKKVLVEIIA